MLIAGPIGLLIGLFIGHQLDKKAMQIQAWNPFRPVSANEQAALNDALFDAVFSILGHLAKADGRVSEKEIAQAEALMTRMGLSGERRAEAIRQFNLGKQPDFALDQVVATFRARTQKRKLLTLNFIEILLSAALADGELHAEEEAVLLRVAQGLGIPEGQFRQLLGMLLAQARFAQGGYQQDPFGSQQAGGYQPSGRQGPSLAEAYAVLGVDASVSDADVKRTYRRLMSQHHPDKLAAQGLSEEMIRAATAKTAEISRAYDMIKQSRGFK